MKRRSFLQAGAGAPAVQLVKTQGAPAKEKFTLVPLARHYNASSRDFGPRPWTRNINPPEVKDDLIHTLGGAQQMRGMPFTLGPANVTRKSWIVLSQEDRAWTTKTIDIPINRAAPFLCLAQFCDWEKAEFEPADVDDIESIGATLAEAILIYDDGTTRTFPIRRRFEVNPPHAAWGRECMNAMQSNSWRPVELNDPLQRGSDWGFQQMSLLYKSLSRTALWLWAIENPLPATPVKTLRLEARSRTLLTVCGLTLYHGKENPLRLERRRLYRITLPEATAADKDRWTVDTDLGVVCRTFTHPPFDGDAWLNAGTAGLGERSRTAPDARYLYTEITSSSEATLLLRDTRKNATYEFDLAGLKEGAAVAARTGPSRIEVVEPHKTWIRGRVVDDATGKPVPVRLAMRSRDGRYIPPYGHRLDVNQGWFQDYGADARIGSASFAYIDGNFQVELPVGDIYLEVSKGFEYEAARRRVTIAPHQRELEVRLKRITDWRRNGWVTADTHVHFLSPSTALLEAQAEGINLVNLLAAQWGDLFTNVGDLPHGHLLSHDRETLVALGTENRQHLLGHLGLLGGHGEPVVPMSADGPSEGYIGDPTWNLMSDWADACRAREGLVVAVHFPNPNAEMAAEIVRGKVDAVELYPYGENFQAIAYHDWYRYLNCGYRVAAAGGTDKMGTSTPLGGNRTYAYLPNQEFNFANWAAAVRAGRTFTTSGPLLDFRADGRMPGDEIQLRSGGGSIEVRIEATSFVPFHRLEVVFNGKVVARREEAAGTRQMTLTEKVNVAGPGWLAARCASRVPAARFGVSAHTSPVYLTVPGRELFSVPAAAYFLKLIEGTRLYVQNLAIRPDQTQLKRMVSTLDDAHRRLHQRMEKHRH
jgi:hypothetical protein